MKESVTEAKRSNEQTKKRANEQRSKRANEQTNKQRDSQTNEYKNERMIEKIKNKSLRIGSPIIFLMRKLFPVPAPPVKKTLRPAFTCSTTYLCSGVIN